MPILLYGLNHQSAPIDLRERVAVPPADLDGAVRRLAGIDGVEEGMILSTCNRTELLVSARARGAGQGLRGFLGSERRISDEEMERHCYLYAEQDAVRHVFRVAASLDSMIVGEAQILGQVKEAYAAAVQAGTLGKGLENLMQRAFSVAKRVRTETGVARSPVSIAHAAARLARDIFGDMKDRALLVLGAGKMGRLAARHLNAGGVRSLVVVNRSYQRAVDLARELGGRAGSFDRLFEEMEQADVVVASTAAPHYVVRHEDGLRLMKSRRGRPLFFIDIAVPRDIDPRLNELDNVYLYDIDELGAVVQANLDQRRKEAVCAEAVVERETEAYLCWLRVRHAAPTIIELKKTVEQLRAEEMRRFHGRINALSPQHRQLVDEFGAALINKILHRPIRALKRAAASDGAGSEIEVLRRAFGLEDEGPRAAADAGSAAGADTAAEADAADTPDSAGPVTPGPPRESAG